MCILGVNEEVGKDSMAIILEYITHLGFDNAIAEAENAHRTGQNVMTNQDTSLLNFTAGPSKESCYKLQRAQTVRRYLKG